MDIDTVVYIQCPHCKLGWLSTLLEVVENIDDNGNIRLSKVIVQGMEPTDITKEIHCLACHNNYTPLSGEVIEEDGCKKAKANTCVMNMWRFVGQHLLTCRGK